MMTQVESEPASSQAGQLASSPAPAAPQEAPRISLDQFCASVSTGRKLIELVAAFHFLESRAGRLTDTAAAYQSRFAAVGSRATA